MYLAYTKKVLLDVLWVHSIMCIFRTGCFVSARVNRRSQDILIIHVAVCSGRCRDDRPADCYYPLKGWAKDVAHSHRVSLEGLILEWA